MKSTRSQLFKSIGTLLALFMLLAVFAAVAAASRAHAERIEDGLDLPAALVRAVDVIRTEQRQVLLDLRTVVSDMH